MLVLLFQVGSHRFALEARRILEVVPRVLLQPLPRAPAWHAGLFVYRGQTVPVVDLHRLLEVGPCPAHLSSRIILVSVQHEGVQQTVGLLAAQVADLRTLDPAQAQAGPTEPRSTVFADGHEILHVLEVEQLLSDTVCRRLFNLRESLTP